MAIFSRITDIFKSNINDMLDQAEDPEKMIKFMVLEMEEALTQAVSAVASAMASEKGVERQLAQNTANSAQWQTKAEQALTAGNEALAKEALIRKATYDKSVTQLTITLDQAHKATTQLKDQLDRLKAKLEEARIKESTIIARSQAAKAQTQFAKSVGGFGNDAFAKFEKMEKKVEKQEAEAQAYSELTGAGLGDDDYEKLDKERQANEDLAKLKAKLAGGATNAKV
jgi:phage shock protein A